ncbi:MAG: flagellar basal body rod protein FlgC [Fidelibacterota bacterium]
MAVEGIFSAFQTTLRGLRTEMKKLETISENVANAERAPDENGRVYNKKVVLSKYAKANRDLDFESQMNLKLKGNENRHRSTFSDSDEIEKRKSKDILEVMEIADEKLVYNPAHPRADENGYVRMPKINMVEEMVDLMAASRAYEANINVMNAGKKMAQDTLKI